MKEFVSEFDERVDKRLRAIGMKPDPEQYPYAGRENRMPNQFGQAVMQETDFTPEEVAQLKERGATFPLEVQFPKDQVHLYTERELEADSENPNGSEGRGLPFPYELFQQ